jgi:transcriptional regulator with XRE-family HTH domain
MGCMSATEAEMKEIRRMFGAWLLREIAAHGMSRSTFIARVGYGKGTVSRWINGEATPSPPALVEIARTLRIPPNVLLYRAAGLIAAAESVEFPTLNLPPNLSQGESRLVEHLAWAARHWREEQNAARGSAMGDDADGG